ncbi:hypothetical protein IBC87_08290 [Bifidobacterium adolescentis]|uniref:hypothetical protein n=1 Tax=Bifidobacterium adolescentis TaxID=1680 RepID=UPI0018DE4C1E|nr:hypothetical protein [Bifidobacterium adolescentis]MBH8622097.1 hypothetical protein [Bifidobacterium adolescentis]
MSNKVNGLWAVNSDGVFMFFNSVDSPSVWRFVMSGDVESWRMVPGVVNAQAVRGVAAVYRAEGGVWLDPNGADYAQAVREIGDVPSIVERGGLIASDDCGDYTVHGVSLPDVDRERGWVLSWEHGGMVVSRDVSFLTPVEQDHPEMCETYDDLPVVEPVAPVAQSIEVVEPEPVTAEIPEIPPQTEPHEVVATSSAVIVRKVVIPGGKSVKELADVFGGFKHKPRGFRDSTGRRVAYVAFDGTGGVIAYRDYYTDVDTRLEEQIVDYLAAHNLKLAA